MSYTAAEAEALRKAHDVYDTAYAALLAAELVYEATPAGEAHDAYGYAVAYNAMSAAWDALHVVWDAAEANLEELDG